MSRSLPNPGLVTEVRGDGPDGPDGPASIPVLVAVVSLVLALAYGCAPRHTSPEALRLGIVVGITGVEAARVAVKEINVAGGIGGRPLELRVATAGGATRAQAAIATADALLRDPSVLAVIGHSNSASSLAASQIYNAGGLPQIAPTTTAVLFGKAGPYSFRLVADDRRQAALLARQAVDLGESVRVAILYVNDDYGRGLNAELLAELARYDVEVAYQAPYLEDEEPTSLAGAVRSLETTAPDLLFWLGRQPYLADTLPLLRAALPGLRVVGSDGLDHAETFTNPYYAGLRLVRLAEPIVTRRYERFLRVYRERTGDAGASEAVLTYDAVALVASALRAGARSRDEVRQYLASVGRDRPAFQGLGGPISFDENGDADRPFNLVVLDPEGLEVLDRE